MARFYGPQCSVSCKFSFVLNEQVYGCLCAYVFFKLKVSVLFTLFFKVYKCVGRTCGGVQQDKIIPVLPVAIKHVWVIVKLSYMI